MVDNINWPSFGAGLAAGVVGTLAFNRARRFIDELGKDEQRAVVRTVAQAEADRGYLRALVEMAQASHLMGHKLRLGDILMEPHFIRPPDLVKLPDEDDDIDRDVFEVVPQIHAYPFLHAPYNLTNIEIDDLGRGDGTLALIGVPGSGRTTALLTIALWSAGFVDFKQPDDVVAQQLREQEEKLTPQQQADRIKKRVALAERARERFAEARGEKGQKVDGAASDKPLGQVDNATSRFRSLAPIYVHLANVIPTSGEYGRRIDPAEPLIRGLQMGVGFVVSKRIVGKTYKMLQNGQALVLIDGFDDIPHHERPAMMVWLKTFVQMYKNNFIIIAMPPEGYGPLMEVGAMPVYLRPWDDQQQRDSTHKWVEHWEKVADNPIQIDRDTYREPELFYNAVAHGTRTQTTFDTTLHIWTNFNGQPGNESEQMLAYLRSRLPNVDDVLPSLENMAAMQLDEGYITLRRLVAQLMERELAKVDGAGSTPQPVETPAEPESVVVEAMQPEPEPVLPSMPDDDALAEFFGPAQTPAPAAVISEPPAEGMTEHDGAAILEELAEKPKAAMTEAEKAVAKRQSQISREQGRLLKKLLKVGLLVAYRGGRYQFRHAFIAAYLAARFVVDADEYTLIDKEANPNWEHAMCYLAQMRDVDFLVAQHLADNQLDVLHERLLQLTRRVRFAGPDVAWRNSLLRYLGNLMVANNQFTLVRERIAAALIGMRDEGTLVIFRRAMQHRNPDIRKLGCLCVGVLRDDAAINPLSQIILQDSDVDVQIAAALALSIIGSEDALDGMVNVFEQSSVREVRRAIAESLAANRDQGYLTLFDALKAEEMLMRRAAVFGLGRVRADWALIALNETFLDDAEWYVRSAAQTVFSDIYEASLRGVHAYPQVTDTPWLNEWAQEQIETGNLPHDIQGKAVFEAALKQDADPLIRLLATMTVGQLGVVEKLGDTYLALRDHEDAIRDAAYRALGEFQQRLGQPLPAPVG